ncbi:RcpC/CpaB family pilus assembly protein [Paenarthrobacter nitroguajacolicus]|uniref:Flp pilus assembly protein CpaB n=1 Tax=Paenarthrobacter nitroguajacolicus TaxID=211146 RepID=UPI00285A7583|nr:RcpC/CpaB family pilus assembly protein [Paenarthrobacter nitroguajacolicus]MDR6638088.1 pilus assembly protein CpaB [Paenarthrobacter nitroguajacolicus]
MKTRLLGGIAALLLAVIGTVLLVTYVQGADKRAQEGLDPVSVLVVKERIPAGTKAEEIQSKVKVETLPQSAVAPGTISALTDQTGKVTSADLQPGEQLLGMKLVSPKELAPGTVPVPEGLQESTFVLSPERILGGRIEAGDTVTVYASFKVDDAIAAGANLPAGLTGWKNFTELLYHDVLVTAVQQAAPDAEKSAGADKGVALPNGSAYVTVALSDANASKMVFGAEFGTLWLSKQNEKTAKSDPPTTTFGGLLQ